jgi:hypothetical protein
MMATAPFNTNLTVQPMQTQSPMTGLSDMLNLARGMQSYQQAAEMNPLQVQQLKQQVQQAERLNPLQVQQAATQTEQARFQLDMDQNGLARMPTTQILTAAIVQKLAKNC